MAMKQRVLPEDLRRDLGRAAHAQALASFGARRAHLEAQALALLRAGRTADDVRRELLGIRPVV